MRFKSYPPLAKLAVWAGLALCVTLVVQAFTWAARLDFNALGNSGVLLGASIISLLIVMSAEQRPVADFGFIVGPVWKKLFLQGAAIGAGVYLALMTLALVTGVATFRGDLPSAKIWGKAVLNGMTAMPLSATQQILFTGYLLTMLRDRYRPLTAVLISAAMFAVIGRLENPSVLFSLEIVPMLTALFLAATLLGLTRLRTGSILTSVGILAGWLFVRRFTGRAKLLAFDPQADAAWWLAPQGDFRNSPLFCAVVGAGIIHCLVMLRRHGEKQVDLSGPAIDADFRRVFPLSNSGLLAPLDVWIGRLCDARFRIGAAFIPRFIAVLVMSTVNMIVTLPERLLLPLVLRGKLSQPPVFILGVQRSGTTHLHNLLSLDPQFRSARTYHMLNPAGCVVTGWLITPFLGLFLPYKRPMDGVRFHLFTVQEDEFVLAGECGMSPYWSMTFPRRSEHYAQYLLPQDLAPDKRERWKRHYAHALRKIALWSRRRMLSKNPYNTGRVEILREMYPDAQFIHIHRHPITVSQSNTHMARTGHVMNHLQDPDPAVSYEDQFLRYYRIMEDAYYESMRNAPEPPVDVAFEELERDPIGVVRSIYTQLGLTFSEAFETRLQTYLEGLADYRKNKHRPVTDEHREQVRAEVGHLAERWGYSLDEAAVEREPNPAAARTEPRAA